MSERMAVMVPVGLPAKAVAFIVLMPKNRWCYCWVNRECAKGLYFWKKRSPGFSMGRHIDNRPRQSLLQADWKKGVPLIHSFGDWE